MYVYTYINAHTHTHTHTHTHSYRQTDTHTHTHTHQGVASSTPTGGECSLVVQKAKRECEQLRVVEEEDMAAKHLSQGAFGDGRFVQVRGADVCVFVGLCVLVCVSVCEYTRTHTLTHSLTHTCNGCVQVRGADGTVSYQMRGALKVPGTLAEGEAMAVYKKPRLGEEEE